MSTMNSASIITSSSDSITTDTIIQSSLSSTVTQSHTAHHPHAQHITQQQHHHHHPHAHYEEEISALRDQLQYQEQAINDEINLFRVERAERERKTELERRRLLEELELAKSEILALRTENEQLTFERDQAVGENGRLHEREESLASDLFRSREDIEYSKKIEQELKQIKEEHIELKKKYFVLAECYERNTNKMEALQESIEFERTQNEFNERESLERNLESQNKELRAKLEKSHVELDSIRCAERAKDVQINDLNSCVSELRLQLEECRRKYQLRLNAKTVRLETVDEINTRLKQEILYLIQNFGTNQQQDKTKKLIDEEFTVL